MAGIDAIAQTAEVALTAATAKTVIQVSAPANQRLRVKGWGVFFDGVSATEAPVQVELMRQTTAGTMTALTPKNLGVGSETIQTTASHTATAEPTSGDVLDSIEVHPQTNYEKQIAMDTPLLVPGGGRVGIVCTAPSAVNVRAKIIFEE